MARKHEVAGRATEEVYAEECLWFRDCLFLVLTGTWGISDHAELKDEKGLYSRVLCSSLITCAAVEQQSGRCSVSMAC